MPRPSKPVSINKKRFTIEEKQFRQEQEEKLKTGENFNEHTEVKNDLIAHKEFIRLSNLYQKLDFVDGLDEQIINRYCLEISKKDKLNKLENRIYERINLCEENEMVVELYKVIAQNERNRQKINEMLLKFERELFLTPAARIKACPKKPEKIPIDENAYLFGE